MMLSESLRKGVLDTFTGGLINKFQIRSRRVVLIFEDILSEYIKRCEDAGYKKEMEDCGAYWTGLTMQDFLPSTLTKLPLSVISKIGASIWYNLGLVENMDVRKENDMILIETKKEYITRNIGQNHFAVGAYRGILGVLTGKNAECVFMHQNRNSCCYVFKIKDDPWKKFCSKGKTRYDLLNQKFFEKGYALKEVLRMKIFRIRDNKLTFRGRVIIPVENTLFSILGNKSIMMDTIAEISNDFFKKIIKTKNMEESLPLLKKLMQIMGWGSFNILVRSQNEIDFEIRNMPYGLQKEEDNWDFLSFMLLGYLSVFRKNFKMNRVSKDRILKFEFRTD